MNILVVSEILRYGGLETRLHDFSEYWEHRNHKVFYAVNEYDKDFNSVLSQDRIYSNLPITPFMTSKELCELVNMLCQLITDNDIDFIDAQPFNSILPALFAANITKRPMVVTIHGVDNIRYTYDDIHYHILNHHFALHYSDMVVATSAELEGLLSVYSTNVYTIPNGINVQKYSKLNVNPNGPWAVISRLDQYKIPGICDFIDKMGSCGIKSIHFWGEFSPEGELLRQEIKSNADKWGMEILFKGRSTDIHSALESGYAGIGGMGRVILEAVSMNMPAFLIGYNGTLGLLDVDLFNKASESNYIGRGFSVCTQGDVQNALSRLTLNPKQYLLRDQLIERIDKDRIWSNYESIIKKLPEKTEMSDVISSVYDLFKAYSDKDQPYLQDYNLIKGVIDLMGDSHNHYGVEAYRKTTEIYHRINSMVDLINANTASIILKSDELESRLIRQNINIGNINDTVTKIDNIILSLKYIMNRPIEKARYLFSCFLHQFIFNRNHERRFFINNVFKKKDDAWYKNHLLSHVCEEMICLKDMIQSNIIH